MRILNENARETCIPASIINRCTTTGYQLELVETHRNIELYYCGKVDMYVQIHTEQYRNEHKWLGSYFKDAGDPAGPDLIWLGTLIPSRN